VSFVDKWREQELREAAQRQRDQDETRRLVDDGPALVQQLIQRPPSRMHSRSEPSSPCSI
jgi:hypothetical protein